jgi:hypothetical protein
MKTVSNLIVTKSVETKNEFNSIFLFSVHLSQIELRRLAWIFVKSTEDLECKYQTNKKVNLLMEMLSEV